MRASPGLLCASKPRWQGTAILQFPAGPNNVNFASPSWNEELVSEFYKVALAAAAVPGKINQELKILTEAGPTACLAPGTWPQSLDVWRRTRTA